jgi:hypothetical protein
MKSQNSRNQVFTSIICLLIEGSNPKTYGSYGSADLPPEINRDPELTLKFFLIPKVRISCAFKSFRIGAVNFFMLLITSCFEERLDLIPRGEKFKDTDPTAKFPDPVTSRIRGSGENLWTSGFRNTVLLYLLFLTIGFCFQLVLEQIVTTIASVADTAEENFADHYDK